MSQGQILIPAANVRCMLALPVYLDNHATTRLDPRVLEEMLPYFCEEYGNASSASHRFGKQAARAVERAREEVAALFLTPPETVVFTSGATEANNLAIKGVLRRVTASGRPVHVVTSAIEHKSILDPLKRLARQGAAVTVLSVDSGGRVDLASAMSAIRPETALVSLMAANNEIGTVQPAAELAQYCQTTAALFHCDAVQAAGRIPWLVDRCPADLLSVSAHKLYGPKGVGALIVTRRRRVDLEPLLEGGGQEGRLRSGTLPVPLIVGMGAACRIASLELDREAKMIAALRDRLWAGLRRFFPAAIRNGHPDYCLPGNLHVTLPGVNGDLLLARLDAVAASSGAACSTASPEPSHVLRAIGLSDKSAKSSLRFGLGRFNTAAEIDFAAQAVAECAKQCTE